MDTPSKDELAAALKAAGAAHHDYESNALSGEPDEHWPGWYAAYVLGRLGDFTTPTKLASWLADAPADEDWARSAADHVGECLARRSDGT